MQSKELVRHDRLMWFGTSMLLIINLPLSQLGAAAGVRRIAERSRRSGDPPLHRHLLGGQRPGRRHARRARRAGRLRRSSMKISSRRRCCSAWCSGPMEREPAGALLISRRVTGQCPDPPVVGGADGDCRCAARVVVSLLLRKKRDQVSWKFRNWNRASVRRSPTSGRLRGRRRQESKCRSGRAGICLRAQGFST